MTLAGIAAKAKALDDPTRYVYNVRGGWEQYSSLDNLKKCHPNLTKEKIAELMAKGTIRVDRMRISPGTQRS